MGKPHTVAPHLRCGIPPPSPEEHDLDRLEYDLDIEQETPILDVEDIQADFLVERILMPSVSLRHSRDSRLEGEDPLLMILVEVDLSRLMRPRSDERHLSSQHIEELRELVDGVLLDEGPDDRLPRVVSDLVERSLPYALLLDEITLIPKRGILFRLHSIRLFRAVFPFHVSEFVQVEKRSVLPHSLIPIDDWACRILSLDHDSYDREERHEDDQSEEAQKDVSEPLDDAPPWSEPNASDLHDGQLADEGCLDVVLREVEEIGNILVSDTINPRIFENHIDFRR